VHLLTEPMAAVEVQFPRNALEGDFTARMKRRYGVRLGTNLPPVRVLHSRPDRMSGRSSVFPSL
jgi:hypothetical protein